MSKNKKTLLILLIAVLVLGIAFAVILITAPKEENGSDTEKDESVFMYEMTSSDWVKAEISNPKGGYTILASNGEYSIESLAGYKLDSYNIGWIGDKLCRPNAGRKVSDASSDLSEYGLTDPDTTCTITKADGSTVELMAGTDSPGGGTYFKTSLDDNIYIVTNNLPVYLKRPAAWFVDTDIIPTGKDYPEGTDTNISYMYIGGKARDEELEICADPTYDAETASHTETPYKMTLPIKYNINSTTTGDLMQYCASMTFSECVSVDTSPENLAALGLNDPDYVLVYKFADVTNRIIFSVSDEYYYAMLDGCNAIFAAYPTYTSFLGESADTYMSRITFGKPLTALSKLRVSCNGKEWVFRVDHKDDVLLPSYGSLEIDEQNFKQYYENLIMTLSEGRAKTVPENPVPYLTITYSFNDGSKDVTASFVPAEGTKYIYQIDGEGIFYILKSQVDAILQDTDKLSRNETIKTTI